MDDLRLSFELIQKKMNGLELNANIKKKCINKKDNSEFERIKKKKEK